MSTVAYNYGGYLVGTYANGVFTADSGIGDSASASIPAYAGTLTQPNSTFVVNGPVTDSSGYDNAGSHAVYVGYVTVSGAQYMITNDPSIPGTDQATLFYHQSSAPASLNSVLAGTSTPAVTAQNNAFCFLAGTLIATKAGSVPVENIKIGDYVLGLDGLQHKVYWIGIKTMTSAFTPKDQLPIEISAGALANGVPERNCRVMPSHAILIADVLVVAGKLVNGTTIRQLAPAELGLSYTYYAIETEGHFIIQAEGMPVETKGNIKGDHFAFDNWEEYVALYGADGRDYPVLPNHRVRLIDELPGDLIDKLPQAGCLKKAA